MSMAYSRPPRLTPPDSSCWSGPIWVGWRYSVCPGLQSLSTAAQGLVTFVVSWGSRLGVPCLSTLPMDLITIVRTAPVINSSLGSLLNRIRSARKPSTGLSFPHGPPANRSIRRGRKRDAGVFSLIDSLGCVGVSLVTSRTHGASLRMRPARPGHCAIKPVSCLGLVQLSESARAGDKCRQTFQKEQAN